MRSASNFFRPDDNRAVDVVRSLAPLAMGKSDPCLRRGQNEVWLASNTPAGPATVCYQARDRGVAVMSWGEGSDWIVSQAPRLFSASLDLGEVESVLVGHPVLRELARERAKVRPICTDNPFEALFTAVLAQRVTGMEANRSWADIVTNYGEPAPRAIGGPTLLLPPSASVTKELPSWQLHKYGVERKRAETLGHIADNATLLRRCITADAESAREQMMLIPGIGIWSSSVAATKACGHLDAPAVGDFHLKNQVAWLLRGQPRGTDEEMLAALEEFRPYTGWVAGLILTSGRSAPKFGPRYSPLPIAVW